jgi:hypothetical protein
MHCLASINTCWIRPRNSLSCCLTASTGSLGHGKARAADALQHAVILQLPMRPRHRVGIDRLFAGEFADRRHQLAGPQCTGGDREGNLTDDLLVDCQSVGRVDAEEHAAVLCTSDVIQQTRSADSLSGAAHGLLRHCACAASAWPDRGRRAGVHQDSTFLYSPRRAARLCRKPHPPIDRLL